MPNTYVNKVTLSNGTTLIDLTSDTVTSAAHIVSGRIGHLSDGSVVTGTAEAGSGVASIENVPNATGTTAVIDGTDASHIVEDYDLSETALGSDGSVDLSEAIEALTTYSNEVTGESDTTLSEAVATLAEGYGSGGYSIDDIANGGSSISGAITITGTYIRQYAFCNTDITSVDAPNLIDGGAGHYFRSCTKLVSANLPKLAATSTLKSAYVFAECSSLETVNAPLMRVGGGTFDGCVKLKKYVNTQTAQMNIGAYEYRNCSSLEALDLNKIGQFGASYAWNNTSALSTIVLRRSDAIVPLNSTSNVPPTMKSGGTGCTVYVPSALVSTYETAANWSTLVAGGNLTFAAIENSQYKNYYVDGTPISS